MGKRIWQKNGTKKKRGKKKTNLVMRIRKEQYPNGCQFAQFKRQPNFPEKKKERKYGDKWNWLIKMRFPKNL